MTMIRAVAVGLLAATALAGSALAQDAPGGKLKVGLMLTLSRPGRGARPAGPRRLRAGGDKMGGKLGGREAEIVVVDDELKPDVAVTKVAR